LVEFSLDDAIFGEDVRVIFSKQRFTGVVIKKLPMHLNWTKSATAILYLLKEYLMARVIQFQA